MPDFRISLEPIPFGFWDVVYVTPGSTCKDKVSGSAPSFKAAISKGHAGCVMSHQNARCLGYSLRWLSIERIFLPVSCTLNGPALYAIKFCAI